MFSWTFLQKGFLETLSIFHHFWNSSKNFSEFWWENFGRVVTTVFYMYIGKFWRKYFSFQKFHKFFSLFSDSERQICGFVGGDFASVVKNAFSVAKESFLMEKNTFVQKKYIHLLWFLPLFFVFLPTMLRQAWQISIVHVQTNNLTNKFFGKLIIFSSFPDFEQNFLKFDKKFSAALSQLHSACPDEDFFSIFEGRKWGKIFFRKSCIAIIFRLWTKNILSALPSIVTADLSKIRCTCSDEPFNK